MINTCLLSLGRLISKISGKVQAYCDGGWLVNDDKFSNSIKMDLVNSMVNFWHGFKSSPLLPHSHGSREMRMDLTVLKSSYKYKF